MKKLKKIQNFVKKNFDFDFVKKNSFMKAPLALNSVKKTTFGTLKIFFWCKIMYYIQKVQ